MKINQVTRDKVIGKELPWLLQYIPIDAEEFTVQLIDINTFSIKNFGRISSVSGSFRLLGWILLFDAQGSLIGEVGGKDKEIRTFDEVRFRWGWPPWKYVPTTKKFDLCETVEQAINRIGPSATSIRYIVEYGWDDCVSHICIHKLPKSVPDLMTQSERKAAQAVAEIHKVLES